ncbi:hypothetical protein HUU39_26180 [candidate division KSB1 bacterium]|nr:hypothetical protein [candidate division KSB1 bacterium]
MRDPTNRQRHGGVVRMSRGWTAMGRMRTAKMMQPRRLMALLLAGWLGNAAGQERELGRIVLSEPAGLPRMEEYVEVSLQASVDEISIPGDMVYAIAENSGKKIDFACREAGVVLAHLSGFIAASRAPRVASQNRTAECCADESRH